MGLLDSHEARAYLERCTEVHYRSGTRLIFTRDAGHHSLGWWKNPDYERCLHLSLSFFDPETGEPAPYDGRRAEKWAQLFFGRNLRLVWVEPPYSDEGKTRGVHHFRLFCDPSWAPIKPRGEVYTRELTERGWRSFSEIKGTDAHGYEPPMGVA